MRKQPFTKPNEGYIDGILSYYSPDQINQVLIDAIQKELSPDDSFEGRAYMVIKEMPDAKVGTVLRPVLNYETGGLSESMFGKEHYNYASKYVGRQSVLHKEIVHRETTWFVRIN